MLSDYNGDREPGKRVETRYSETENGPQNNSVVTTHYLRSTVLGGAVIVGIDEWGAKNEGHVYANGRKITDQYGAVRDVNPVTGVWVSTFYASGIISGYRTELDPLGTEVGVTNPYVSGGSYEGMMGMQSLYEERGNPFDLGGGCATVDGLPMSCSELRMRMQGGSIATESLVAERERAVAPRLIPKGTQTEPPPFKTVLNVYRNPIFSQGVGLYFSDMPVWKGGAPAPGINNEGYYIDWENTLIVLPQNPCGVGPMPEAAGRAILKAADAEGIDPTLLSVTWRHESTFDFYPVPNDRIEDGKLVGYDVGPLQLSTNYYNKSPFTKDLPHAFRNTSFKFPNPRGAFANELNFYNPKARFSGVPEQNLLAGARAFKLDILPRSTSLADAAGLYRAGARKGPYQGRFNEYTSEAAADMAYLNCLRAHP